MSEPIVFPTVDGQEIQQSDFQNLGAVSGLADDRVLAEILRLAPYDGTNVYKAVVPYGVDFLNSGGTPGGAFPGATVAPTGSANGSVLINPFRYVVGSRNTAVASPPSPNPASNYQSNALANWRDIRSSVFVGTGATAPSLTQALAANSSGSNRWDLIYAIISPDANGPSVTRRVKSPSTSVVTSQSVTQFLSSSVTIGVVQGTPGSPPALPSIPADSGGNYNFPLAYVLVPTGFNGTSTVLSTSIRPYATTTAKWRIPGPPGHFSAGSGNNDVDGTYLTNFIWSMVGASRPAPFLPPDWIGNVVHKFVELDMMTVSPSHPNGSTVDSTLDWRKRFILSFVQVDGSNKFANDPSLSGGSNAVPYAPGTDARAVNTGLNIQMGNTFATDGGLVSGKSTVFINGHTYNTVAGSESQFGFYVDPSSGKMLMQLSGSPACRAVVWLMASPQFPNL